MISGSGAIFKNLVDKPFMGRFPCCNFLPIEIFPNIIPTSSINQMVCSDMLACCNVDGNYCWRTRLMSKPMWPVIIGRPVAFSLPLKLLYALMKRLLSKGGGSDLMSSEKLT